MFGRLDSVIFKETSVLVAALRKKVFSDVVLACTLGKQGQKAKGITVSQGVRSISVNSSKKFFQLI